MESKETFETVEINIDDPPTDEIKHCLDVWRGWCKDDVVPYWTGSEMLFDLPTTILPFTNIVDVQSDPKDFIYRLWGTGFNRTIGSDMTHKSCRDISPKKFADYIEEIYEEVVSRKAPILYEGDFIDKLNMRVHEFVLRMPLSSDGENVDKIISLIWIDQGNITEWLLKRSREEVLL